MSIYKIHKDWSGARLHNTQEVGDLTYTVEFKENCEDCGFTKIATGTLEAGCWVEVATKGDGTYNVSIDGCTSCGCYTQFNTYSDLLKELVPQIVNTICAKDCKGCNDFLDDTATMSNLVKLYAFFNFSDCDYARSGRIIGNIFNCTMLAMLNDVKCETQYSGKQEWSKTIERITALQYLALYFTDIEKVCEEADKNKVDAFYEIERVTKCLAAQGIDVCKLQEEFNTLTATCMSGNCTDEFQDWVLKNTDLFDSIVKNYLTSNPQSLMEILKNYLGNSNSLEFISELLKQILSQSNDPNSEIYKIFKDILSEYFNSDDSELIESILQNILNSIKKEIAEGDLSAPITNLFEEILKTILGNNESLLCEFIDTCTTAGGGFSDIGFLVIPGTSDQMGDCVSGGTFAILGTKNTTQQIRFIKNGPAQVTLNVGGSVHNIGTSAETVNVAIPASGEVVATYTMRGTATATPTPTDLNYLTHAGGTQSHIGNLMCHDCDANAPVDPNDAPVARIQVTAPAGNYTDDNYVFNGSSSTDSDGTIVGYLWDFGDGSTATSAAATHAFQAPGTYTITLTVTDDDGATGSATRQVTVVEKPVPVDNPPTVSIQFNDGSTGEKSCTSIPCEYRMVSTAVDPDGTSIGRYQWQQAPVNESTGAVGTFVNIPGATSANYTHNQVDYTKSQFRLKVYSNGLEGISNVLGTDADPVQAPATLRVLKSETSLCYGCYAVEAVLQPNSVPKTVTISVTTANNGQFGGIKPDCPTVSGTDRVTSTRTETITSTKGYTFTVERAKDVPGPFYANVSATVTIKDAGTSATEATQTFTGSYIKNTCSNN